MRSRRGYKGCGHSDTIFTTFPAWTMIVCMCYIPGPSDKTKTRLPSGGWSNEASCLTLPGNPLDVSALLQDKKFRHRGNKEGALQAMKVLVEGAWRRSRTWRGPVLVCSMPSWRGETSQSSQLTQQWKQFSESCRIAKWLFIIRACQPL